MESYAKYKNSGIERIGKMPKSRDYIRECLSVQKKDSGVDWIGDIPEHWEVTKTKWMFEIVKRLYDKEDRNILSITQRGLKIKNIEENDGQLAESYIGYQVVNVNDFTMNSMDLLTGWVDCSQFEGVTSPDYRVFRFLPGKEQCYSYYKYLFQMCYKTRIFYRLGQGVSNLGRWRLQADQFLNMKLPQPPVDEQEKIATYLDKNISQIEVLLTDLQKQAEMLDIYKRALIAETVMKGLDNSATMKDSGVNYIGEIPEHWDIVPLRAYLKVVSVKNNPDLPLLSVEREKGVVDRETEGSENNHNRIPDDLTNYKVVRAGQFVMNKMKAWRGSYGVSAYDGIVSPAYYVFDLNFPNPTFFNYTIRSAKYIGFFGRDSYGIRTDQWDFKISAIKDIPLAVPPIDEQNAIAEYLERTIPRIEGLIADINAQIEKLNQYRQVVICDAVTGKIKVTEG